MQGKLRNEPLTIKIETECAHCSRPMEIEIDSNLHYKAKDGGCQPVIFVPDIDFSKLKEDSIIDSF